MKRILILALLTIGIVCVNGSTYDDLGVGNRPFIFIDDFYDFLDKAIKGQDPGLSMISDELVEYLAKIVLDLEKKTGKENEDLKSLKFSILDKIGSFDIVKNQYLQEICCLVNSSDVAYINKLIKDYAQKYNVRCDLLKFKDIFFNFVHQFTRLVDEKRKKLDQLMYNFEKEITDKYSDKESMTWGEIEELMRTHKPDYLEYLKKEYERLERQEELLGYCEALVTIFRYNDFDLSPSEILDFLLKNKKIIIDLMKN